MKKFTVVSRQDHLSFYFSRPPGYGHVRYEQTVPVLLAEISRLLLNYTIGFLKTETGFQLAALIGIDGKSNLYVTSDGKWLCDYVPAALRLAPFALMKNSDGNKVLCIDTQFLHDKPDRHPIFETDGTLSKETEELVNFLRSCEQSEEETNRACELLAKADVIEPWPLTISFNLKQSHQRVEGFYRVSEHALNRLTSDQLGELRQHQALKLAYAQIVSAEELSHLTKRVEFLESSYKKIAEEAVPIKLSDSGSLSFDNI